MRLFGKKYLMSVALGIGLMSVGQPLFAAGNRVEPIIVTNDMGGLIGNRQDRIRSLREQGTPVEIRGNCFSACTMYLGLPNVCVTPDAVLGFHGPKGVTGTLSSDVFDHWSRVMAQDLRQPLKVWFMQEARFVKSGLLRVSGQTLINMGYYRCPDRS